MNTHGIKTIADKDLEIEFLAREFLSYRYFLTTMFVAHRAPVLLVISDHF